MNNNDLVNEIESLKETIATLVVEINKLKTSLDTTNETALPLLNAIQDVAQKLN
jgi:uncharacterized coiled-coil DUF342 family protein